MNWKNNIKRIGRGFLRGDHVCPWWLAYTFDNPLRKFLHDPAALLAPYVREGMTVADIGCGMGYFSLAMARMVGEKGTVIAVDIQQEMLDKLRKRAEKHGLARKIRPVLAAKGDLRLKENIDFVLAFWMVHETGDIPGFLKQVWSLLKPGAALLIAEPRLHVSSGTFGEILRHARAAGFNVSEGPKVRISRTAVLNKPVQNPSQPLP
jgi:2-polyprenyl-3-methyl-5-hydroxy-6-metoxy-1,4-benzoquinol methylase